ncbi:MAG: hypothetical protein J6A53_07430 [Clostridia bacterium]|nr:hypothetical protein [Clostridia bacterium]
MKILLLANKQAKNYIKAVEKSGCTVILNEETTDCDGLEIFKYFIDQCRKI